MISHKWKAFSAVSNHPRSAVPANLPPNADRVMFKEIQEKFPRATSQILQASLSMLNIKVQDIDITIRKLAVKRGLSLKSRLCSLVNLCSDSPLWSGGVSVFPQRNCWRWPEVGRSGPAQAATPMIQKWISRIEWMDGWMELAGCLKSTWKYILKAAPEWTTIPEAQVTHLELFGLSSEKTQQHFSRNIFCPLSSTVVEGQWFGSSFAAKALGRLAVMQSTTYPKIFHRQLKLGWNWVVQQDYEPKQQI